MPAFQTSPPRRPVVGIIADSIEFHGHRGHSVLHGYVRAVNEIAQAMPVMLPVAAEVLDGTTLLGALDGIVLTGSPSNVAAERYGASALPAATRQDTHRDAVVFGLLPALIRRGLPVLGICRGFQELNVIHRGTLEPAVHEQPGRLDHREGDHNRPIERWYDNSHPIHVIPGGVLEGLAGELVMQVNSLHHQGVDRLGDGLRPEATAPDGLVEAFSIADVPQFTLAVQWHPEMRIDDCPLSRAIFAAFGNACRTRQREREQAILSAS
ncbi:Gamma-glutamyl-gamma-aminobutyrate hydrolase PuuD [Paraburkholderia domus]|jgi:putative glutamine amidotransferase|uniref:gamma-glutamyl-gamma-aminobutyrate hydrolase n=1 Tax=Paraburkholderia domus TaxID=2793075 RepID=A0A9N8QUR8_9BURK|nr:gamma-glutamyl-gamma-aminobutyrate hydrolase family protein [Paraburkholderia domus]MBK5053630.1 gamma-glutamyl-gamma-aminobutyrate hydrolase family protein [Burkholderia sp. R-70006]MBK5064913.1 gamma-glutamyl-gamma-aminobutyrate hydrolase family protein [Burkholderia sp. R-70199]MBK5090900.1 gamma-glutamyl-gamma-aminobutyrate hydrolase family protein [Burkholderia sp. R-69927]MBK5125035.1 gamma-glutamyl-gamma-aminobutyrate hydrolase family protein [Burkholderia sp. R-69980]MBK5168541.1 ga